VIWTSNDSTPRTARSALIISTMRCILADGLLDVLLGADGGGLKAALDVLARGDGVAGLSRGH
jgi:hypothetical protein